MQRSGFVSISGQPNVGKSTLLNGFLREKVAIISKRPETTRDTIRGILTLEDCQVIFIDTPGIHKPHDLLGKIMLSRAQSSIMESDVVLFVTEKRIAFNEGDMSIVERLPDPEDGKKVILIINKVDRIRDKKVLLPLLEKARNIYPFDDMIPVSALKRPDLDRVLKAILSHLPEGPFLYPADELTDKTEAFMIQEIIREKLLTETREEIPHSVAVLVDDMSEDTAGGKTEIHATVFVERTSQKSIIIGKNGAMLKKIGTIARPEIEELISKPVYLHLWVKVSEKWKKNPNALREMGYAD